MTESSASSTLLEVSGVTREFPMDHEKVLALREITLKVQTGEKLCITGRSGAGKSTLLHIMGGLDKPSRGSVVFKGNDLYSISAAKRSRLRANDVGFVFQAYYLIPELSVYENIFLPAMNSSIVKGSSRELKERALDLANAVGLDHRLHHRPRELSGGEQQRAALARALMNKPEIIFADEPTGNLDAATGGAILDLLFDVSGASTLVMVTHSEVVAERCTRHIHLDHGRRE